MRKKLQYICAMKSKPTHDNAISALIRAHCKKTGATRSFIAKKIKMRKYTFSRRMDMGNWKQDEIIAINSLLTAK